MMWFTKEVETNCQKVYNGNYVAALINDARNSLAHSILITRKLRRKERIFLPWYYSKDYYTKPLIR